MKKLLAFTLIFTLAFSVNTCALPQYSAETQKLMQEAGIEYDTPLDEVMRRQEAYKKNKSTPTQEIGLKSTNTTSQRAAVSKNGFDELRVNENYLNDVWHPDYPVVFYEGFDELRTPDMM